MPDDACFLRMYTRFSAEVNVTNSVDLENDCHFVGSCATFVDLGK
jgi:hypothetical protein